MVVGFIISMANVYFKNYLTGLSFYKYKKRI